MRPIQLSVRDVFQAAIRDAIPGATVPVSVMTANPKYGDYQCNNAMGLAKAYGSDLGISSPKEMGDKIVK